MMWKRKGRLGQEYSETIVLKSCSKAAALYKGGAQMKRSSAGTKPRLPRTRLIGMVSLPLVCALVISFLPRITVHAQETFELDKFFRRAFLSREFQLKRFGPARWLGKGEAYTTLEKSSQTAAASDLVRYDTETGKREVLIAAADLTPKGAEKPLAIEDYAWSPDANQVLIYTNSQKVWRANTRGDYWLFDRRTKA